MDELKDLKEKIENKTLCYPDYYLQPFHGYDDGNLNWEAAQENEVFIFIYYFTFNTKSIPNKNE